MPDDSRRRPLDYLLTCKLVTLPLWVDEEGHIWKLAVPLEEHLANYAVRVDKQLKRGPHRRVSINEPAARIIWEAFNGCRPAQAEFVYFLDGNPANCRPDNLYLLTEDDLARAKEKEKVMRPARDKADQLRL